MDKNKKLYSNLYTCLLFLIACLIGFITYENDLYKFSEIYGIIIFLCLSIISAFLPVKLPNIGYVTIDLALDFAAILLYKSTAGLIAIASYLIYVFAVRNKTERQNFLQVIFNVSQVFISINASVLLLDKLTQSPGDFINADIFYLLISGLAYTIINTSLVTLCLFLDSDESLTSIWLTNIKWSFPNVLALLALGFIIAYLYKGLAIFGVVLFFVPLILARHTFKLYMDMREIYLDTISSLAATIDAKDEYTLGHSDRVSQYTIAIAREMKLPEDDIENLKYIALLHDIGKIAVPEAILNKPDKLTDAEYDIMKYHAEYGAEIVKKVKFLKGYEIIRAHHERIDGKGYPDNISGDAIPLAARIIAVADSFDAMTSDRPYRKALTAKVAFLELEKCSGKQFDRDVVEAFKRVYPSIELLPYDKEKFLLPKELQEKLKQLSGGAAIAL